MIYAYHCDHCGHAFDVVKRADDYNRPETCAFCNQTARREFVPQRVHLHHTAVQEAEYNPGLGCWTKSRQERDEIARAKGLEEIGNEAPETVHKHFDKSRQERWERSWDEADKGWVGNEG